MRQENKAIVKLYIKQVSTALACSCSMKKAFISEIKEQIEELETQHQALTMEILHTEIGSPEEIARGFDSKEDLDRIKAKARKYTRIKIICAICLALALVAVTVTVIVIRSNDNYYTSTYSGNYKKELS